MKTQRHCGLCRASAALPISDCGLNRNSCSNPQFASRNQPGAAMRRSAGTEVQGISLAFDGVKGEHNQVHVGFAAEAANPSFSQGSPRTNELVRGKLVRGEKDRTDARSRTIRKIALWAD